MGAAEGLPSGELTPPATSGAAGSNRARGLGRALSDVLGAHRRDERTLVPSPPTDEAALDVALTALAAAFAADVSGHCRAFPGEAAACRISGSHVPADTAFALSTALLAVARSGSVERSADLGERLVVATGRGSSIGVLRPTGRLDPRERRLIESLAALVRPRVDRPEWV